MEKEQNKSPTQAGDTPSGLGGEAGDEAPLLSSKPKGPLKNKNKKSPAPENKEAGSKRALVIASSQDNAPPADEGPGESSPSASLKLQTRSGKKKGKGKAGRQADPDALARFEVASKAFEGIKAQVEDGRSSSFKAQTARQMKPIEKIFQEFAKSGHADALLKLGLIYYHGWGVPYDQKYAAKLFRKAAEKGEVQAMIHLGEILEKDKNSKGALSWWHKAVETGDESDADRDKAMFNMALVYEKGRQRDASAALKWYTKAAEMGHAASQVNLALMHKRGDGTSANFELALEWMTRAANQDETCAQENLGLIMFESGNHAKALEWFRRASVLGCTSAQLNLGIALKVLFARLFICEEA